MKRLLYIALLAIICIAAVSGAALSIIKAIQLSEINNEIAIMEESKEVKVDSGESFENSAKKHEKEVLEKRDVSEYLYTYKRDDIYFLSTLEEWNEEGLKELSDELYANKHGEEIKYISSVILYPSDGEPYIGTYDTKKENYDIPLSLYNFLPADLIFDFSSDLSIISLYDANNRVTVEDIAITLSHEYGHHFAEYYFGLEYATKDRLTDYYDIRSQGTTKIRLDYGEFEDYLYNHMWFLAEIAAEDYVYILGSENSHRSAEFMDAKEKVKLYVGKGEDALNEFGYFYKDCRNGVPHENMALPLPDEVDGLVAFFYSFIDEDTPAAIEKDVLGTLNLSIKKTGKDEYRATWDQPYENEDVIYTLIAYTEDDHISHMEKTTFGNQKAQADIGRYEYSYTSGAYIRTAWVGIVYPEGTTIKYRISVTFPDGTVILSDPIEYTY
ncbi:MAG: hypothetical protein AB1Z23_09985 [Eubacteriales bacterium]